MDTANLKMKFPNEGLVYDYLVDDGGLFSSKSEEENPEEDEKAKKKVHFTINEKKIF